MTANTTPTTVELRNIGKSYGDFTALHDVSLSITSQSVTCVLGDNGAGKSTLIKILAGRHRHDAGSFVVDGEERVFRSPTDALNAGIAAVYQDLAVVPEMPVWRNFFLGQEITGRWGLLDKTTMREVTRNRLAAMGVDIVDVDVPIASLSGGQRQVVAIARAVHFGAKVIILDEPTAALGVKQSGMVLRFVRDAAASGLAVVLVTHNPHHAYLVGNQFILLSQGTVTLNVRRDELTVDQLATAMAGTTELDALAHELDRG